MKTLTADIKNPHHEEIERLINDEKMDFDSAYEKVYEMGMVAIDDDFDELECYSLDDDFSDLSVEGW